MIKVHYQEREWELCSKPSSDNIDLRRVDRHGDAVWKTIQSLRFLLMVAEGHIKILE